MSRRGWRISMAFLILLLVAFANQLSVPPSAASLNQGSRSSSAP